MNLTELQLKELRVAFKVWRILEKAEGRAYPTNDDATFQAIAARAVQYGALQGTKSSFTRAAQELSTEGKIRLTVPPPAPTPIPANFEEMLNNLSSGELRIRITPPATLGRTDVNDLRASPVRDHAAGGYDSVFAEWFHRWSAGERPEGFVESVNALTATQWRSLPPDVAALKMKDPSFRAEVQRLIDRGEI